MAINTSKVVVGGIVAGIVANIIDFVSQTYIMGDMITAAMTKLNPALAVKPTGGQIAGFVLLDFVWMFATVWMYAAIRPRFGAGPKTATYAAIVSWIVGTVVASYFFLSGFFGTDVFIASGIESLVNALVATNVGAWLYSENPALSAATAAA